MSGVLEDALRGFLSQKPVVSAVGFRLRTVKGRLVNPALDLDRTSALLVEDDEREFAGERGR